MLLEFTILKKKDTVSLSEHDNRHVFLIEYPSVEIDDVWNTAGEIVVFEGDGFIEKMTINLDKKFITELVEIYSFKTNSLEVYQEFIANLFTQIWDEYKLYPLSNVEIDFQNTIGLSNFNYDTKTILL